MWTVAPAWPLDRETDEQMQFICQVGTFPELFGGGLGRLAYLFITGDEASLVDTFDPDGGGNAIVVQPGGRVGGELVAATEGPALDGFDRPGSREYAVQLSPGEDPGLVGATNGGRVATRTPARPTSTRWGVTGSAARRAFFRASSSPKASRGGSSSNSTPRPCRST